MKKVPVFLSLLLLLAGIICAFIYFLPVETESKDAVTKIEIDMESIRF